MRQQWSSVSMSLLLLLPCPSTARVLGNGFDVVASDAIKLPRNLALLPKNVESTTLELESEALWRKECCNSQQWWHWCSVWRWFPQRLSCCFPSRDHFCKCLLTRILTNWTFLHWQLIKEYQLNRRALYRSINLGIPVYAKETPSSSYEFFYKWAIPTSISFIVFFSNKHYNFYNKYMSKMCK